MASGPSTLEISLRLPSPKFWAGKSVFITGHTGFKGSWLILLLNRLGAKISGYSLQGPVSSPALFEAARLSDLCMDYRGDIRDSSSLAFAVAAARPEVIIHMAAQPIVRASRTAPIETMDINIMGTAKVLEVSRACATLRVVVSVTSDKCYDNQERLWGYREFDPMGGKDPYSASKGCAELVTAAYAQTFFREGPARVISVRAGNVIGGGDWAVDRIIPDLVRAATNQDQVEIRSPSSIRPWQFVLDPLIGYLLAAERAFEGDLPFDSWNFGPAAGDELTVREVVEAFQQFWGGQPAVRFAPANRDAAGLKEEAGLLRVDATKARTLLGWRPTLSGDKAIEFSTRWYRALHAGTDARDISFQQIKELTGL